MPPTAKVGVLLGIEGGGRKFLAQTKAMGAKVQKGFAKIRPLAGMLGGIGGVMLLQNLTKKTMDFDLALTRLAVQGHKSANAQSQMRAEIMRVSKETGLAKEQIVDAGKSIIDSTGDFDFMTGTLENLSSLSRTTGSDMGALGRVAGALANQFNMDAEAANKFMRILVEQGEQGSWTLEEMATTAPKVFAALQMAGVNTEKEIKDATAYMQVFRVGFATAEEAATAYKGTVARLAMEQSRFEAMGVEFDKDGKARATAEILVDVLEKANETGYEGPSLVKLFGTENIALVTAMQKTYKEAKAEGLDLTEVMGKYMDVTGDASEQAKKLARVQESTAGKFDTLKTTLDDVVVTTLLTEENMESLGIAAGGATEALVGTIENIQILAELFAKAADSLGLITKGGTAEEAAKMTPEERAARQAMHGTFMKGEGAALTAQEQEFKKQYTGGGMKAKFLGADPEKMSANLLKTAGVLAATGFIPGAALAAGAAVVAPKVQGWMQGEEAEKFAQTIQIPDSDIDRIAAAVEKGSKAGTSKAKITAPTPLTPAGGTEGTTVHP